MADRFENSWYQVTVKTALIGMGTGGSLFHAPFINCARGLNLSAIVTGNAEREKLAREKYPESEVIKSADELLKRNSEFDLVVITTPNNTHSELANRCLDAGMHVVVDKPFAIATKEARNTIDLAKKRNRLVIPFHNRRFDSDFLTVKKVLEAGLIGEPQRLESRIERYRPVPKAGGWRETTRAEDGGGVLFDLGSHLIDQAICLFGRPQKVSGQLSRRRQLAAEDDAFIDLQYKNGLSVQLYASMMTPLPGPRFRINGLAGAFLKKCGDPQEDMLRRGLAPDAPEFGLEAESHWGKLKVGEGKLECFPSERGQWLGFYEAIAASIQGKSPVPVSAEDALIALEIMDELRN